MIAQWLESDTQTEQALDAWERYKTLLLGAIQYFPEDAPLADKTELRAQVLKAHLVVRRLKKQLGFSL